MDKLNFADNGSMNTFEKFNKAVQTYRKVDKQYTSACSGKATNNTASITLKLQSEDFINPAPASTDITTNCSILTDELIKRYIPAINAKANEYESRIIQDRTAYNITKNDVESKYNALKSKREELDQDVLKMLGADNSILYEKQGILDSAVYTTLLWTVLATSVLYYTFTKL